jgi:uncharacterized membrane protein YhaH (DUF805 family)
MSEPQRNFLRCGGTTSPGRYFAIGFVLTLIKQGLDHLLATRAFGRPWSPMSYAVTGVIGGLLSLDRDDQIFYATMLAAAFPFLVVGVVLTVRRLRDAGWPLWLVALFFAPMPINIVFFSMLCLVPSRSRQASGAVGDVIDGPERAKPTARPEFSIRRAIVAILIPLPVAAAVAYFGTHVLGDYGWSLFIGLPFVLPMLSVVIYGSGRPATLTQCLGIGCLWALTAFVVMVATAFEGLICIVMMLPLAVPVVLLGALVGYFIVGLGARSCDVNKVVAVLFVLLPTMVGAEHATTPEPLLFTCETSVVVDARPEEVWRNVVSFSDLDPPTDWLFRSGVAYPIRARIEGTGAGAIRHCEFSTGAFVEPIEVWDEPRRLQFSVTSNPAPMREWNPLFEIHPPHLDGFLVSKRGEFLLSPLPGGKTLLRGSTLYQHGLWPAAYWRLWSDPIIHRIHDRVLKHIKTLTEAQEAGDSVNLRARSRSTRPPTRSASEVPIPHPLEAPATNSPRAPRESLQNETTLR